MNINTNKSAFFAKVEAYNFDIVNSIDISSRHYTIVPRIKIGEHEIRQVEVPWARPNSGFTMLFEAYTMLLIEDEKPVYGVSEVVKETTPRIWRIFNYWVKKAVDKIDLSQVRRVGVDETSKHKG